MTIPVPCIILLAGALCSAAAGDDPQGLAKPDPSQGSVDASGKFVPAGPPAQVPATPATPEDWQDSASRLIEKTGEHTFRIGMVQCDRATRSLTIPAQVNAREGLIEYALVTRKGKIHEALFTTNADPLHVQMAALLLGISPPPGKPQPCGVIIEVEWATNGPTLKVPLEDLIALAKDTPQDDRGVTMPRKPWNFTGSLIDSHGFVAAREGSLIAIIDDPAALVMNAVAGRPPEHDGLHIPHAAAMPGMDMPVLIRIRLSPPVPQDVAPPAKP
jgi:hypothetical protein